MLLQISRKIRAEPRCRLLTANQCGAVRERHPHLFDGAIEPKGKALKDTICRRRVADLVESFDEMNDVAVLGDHAFWASGRSGREKNVANVRRPHMCFVSRQAAIGIETPLRLVFLDAQNLRPA